MVRRSISCDYFAASRYDATTSSVLSEKHLELNFTDLTKVCLRGDYRGCGGGAVLIVVAVRRSQAQ